MGSFIAWFIRLFVNNPLIIAGIAFASYYKFTYPPHIVKLIFTHAWIPYAIVVGIGFGYAVLIKHIYYPNTKKINWSATLLHTFSHIFTIAIAAALTFGILYAWDYMGAKELDDYLRYKKK